MADSAPSIAGKVPVMQEYSGAAPGATRSDVGASTPARARAAAFDNRLYLGMARLVDVGIGLLLLPILLLLIPVVWVANLFGSRGPLFYTQIRVGRDQQPFRIYKFRSMVVNAEKDGKAQLATSNDCRITRVGRFLRQTRIDEFPQALNLLWGDMTLIGPRPERPSFVADYARKFQEYPHRLTVKPGLTGLAQVRFRYASSDDDTYIKLRYDLWYIRHRCLSLDAHIVWRTVWVMCTRQGT